MTADLSESDARRVLADQPFNRVVGARIARFGDGVAVLELDLQEHHLQQHGLVHGGVLAYLIDNAVTFAAGSVLGPAVVTAGITVSYLRPARRGLLRATAEVAQARSGVAVARAELVGVSSSGERLCAVGQGTVMATTRAAAHPGQTAATATS